MDPETIDKRQHYILLGRGETTQFGDICARSGNKFFQLSGPDLGVPVRVFCDRQVILRPVQAGYGRGKKTKIPTHRKLEI